MAQSRISNSDDSFLHRSQGIGHIEIVSGVYSISDLIDAFSVSRPTIYCTLQRTPGRKPLSQTERQSEKAAAKAVGKGAQDADQAAAAPLLSDQLTATFPFDPLSSRQGLLRALRPPAMRNRPPLGKRLFVRSRDRALAGREGQEASHQSAREEQSHCCNRLAPSSCRLEGEREGGFHGNSRLVAFDSFCSILCNVKRLEASS